MMVFVGIFLFVVYAWSALSSKGIFSEFVKMGEQLEQNQDELMNDEEFLKKLSIEGIKVIGFAIVILIAYLIFLVSGLKIDVLIIPTLIMMTEFIGTLILTKKKKKASRVRVRVVNGMRASYVGYILILMLL